MTQKAQKRDCDGRRNGAVDLSRDAGGRRTGVFVQLAARGCAGYGWRWTQRMGLGAFAPGPFAWDRGWARWTCGRGDGRGHEKTRLAAGGAVKRLDVCGQSSGLERFPNCAGAGGGPDGAGRAVFAQVGEKA